MKKISSYEGLFLLFLQEHFRTPRCNIFMRFATSLADSGFLPISICTLLLFSQSTKRIGYLASISFLLELIIVNLILKPLVRRKRPFVVIENLTCITRIPQDYSFPSGHTACCFAVAGVIGWHMPPSYAIPVLIVSAVVGFSRMYLGVHYPTDVLAGMLTGFFTGILSDFLLSDLSFALIRSFLMNYYSMIHSRLGITSLFIR